MVLSTVMLSSMNSLLKRDDILFFLSLPKQTKWQIGKNDFRTINNAVRTLLFQAQLPPSFWAEVFHTVVHVLNLLPSKATKTKFLTQLFLKKR